MASIKDIATTLVPSGTDATLIDELVKAFDDMANSRQTWLEERDEVLKFLNATDARETVCVTNDFDNSTTIPKLSHIYKNIKSNIIGHLFPSDNWLKWIAHTQASNTKETRETITNFVKGKAKASGLEDELERCAEDLLQCGICVGVTYYAREYVSAGMVTDSKISTYSGPKLRRVDPLKFYHDAAADSMDKATKAIQELYSYGDLRKMVDGNEDISITIEQFHEIMEPRKQAASLTMYQRSMLQRQLERAGFAGALDLASNDKVEMITMFGSFYDASTDTLYDNHKFVIADRRVLISVEPATKWHSTHGLHVGVWDYREGTLAPVGPLNNIVGLQYKIDKLENLRADIFDHIAHPATKEKGDVSVVGRRGAPGARYKIEEDGDISYLHPDVAALNADTQINFTMSIMEDVSCSPREAAGLRTPGEKTKFEVQLLDTGQNRLFRNHVKKFERTFVSPICNDYLTLSRNNMAAEEMEVFDNEIKAPMFTSVTPDMLEADGMLYAVGASITIERANLLQAISTVFNSGVSSIIAPHVSSLQLALALEDLIESSKYGIFKEFAAVFEAAKLEVAKATAQDEIAKINGSGGDMGDTDILPPPPESDMDEGSVNE